MDTARRNRVKQILADLPGGSGGIEHLGQRDAEAINERIMERCCYRARLVASFVDALREPQGSFPDAEGWRKLASFIPEDEREHHVYVAADLYGYFRLPASRTAEVLDSGLWTHEVYVVGANVDWLAGVKHEWVYLQGKAAASLP
jgi:hypothetical protein